MIHQKLQSFVQALHTILGAPNYSQYVHYMNKHHPHQTIQNKDDFYRQMIHQKYNNSSTNRCC